MKLPMWDLMKALRKADCGFQHSLHRHFYGQIPQIPGSEELLRSVPCHKGICGSEKLPENYQPDVVFSKGGFVSVPVVRAAASLHIPCIIHESDMTPGLANKLCIPVAEKVCCNFPETMKISLPTKLS